MVWNEIWHDPHHLGVLSGVSKMIFEPMVRSMQTVQLFCIKLALSPNRPKRSSTRALSPRSTIGCVQNNLWAYGTFRETKQLSCVKISTISKETKMSIHLSLVPLEYHRVRPKWFLSLWYIWHKPCTYLASRLALSANGPKQAST
jgi:hypothetical protein